MSGSNGVAKAEVPVVEEKVNGAGSNSMEGVEEVKTNGTSGNVEPVVGSSA